MLQVKDCEWTMSRLMREEAGSPSSRSPLFNISHIYIFIYIYTHLRDERLGTKTSCGPCVLGYVLFAYQGCHCRRSGSLGWTGERRRVSAERHESLTKKCGSARLEAPAARQRCIQLHKFLQPLRLLRPLIVFHFCRWNKAILQFFLVGLNLLIDLGFRKN